MDKEIDPNDETWVGSIRTPRLGPLDARAILGPVVYMTLAITSLKMFAYAVLWLFAFAAMALFDLTPASTVRRFRNMVFGGDRPNRSYNRVRTQYLGE